MFEKEAEEYFEAECLHSYADTEEELKEDVVAAFRKGAEIGYDRAGEWHFIKDKLPPEPVVIGNEMFPKNYICAYKLNNEYDDYEIGDFLYYGNGEFNGENKDYPIYAWLEKPTVIPKPPKME